MNFRTGNFRPGTICWFALLLSVLVSAFAQAFAEDASKGEATTGSVQYNIRVDGITCPFCVLTSERALRKIDGVQEVQSDLASGTILVCATDSLQLGDEQLRKLFLDKGFTFRSVEKQQQCTLASGHDNAPGQGQTDKAHEHVH